MAGRKRETEWDALIKSEMAASPRIGTRALYEKIEAKAKAARMTSWPSERTVARRQAMFRGEPGFQPVYWPETFERGDLPWEAVPAVRELLQRWWPARPTLRYARWYWRLTTVLPDVAQGELTALVYLLTYVDDEWIRRGIERRLITGAGPTLSMDGDMPLEEFMHLVAQMRDAESSEGEQ